MKVNEIEFHSKLARHS